MRTTIEKVRAAVVVGAALVALIVAGFLVVAHYKAHRLLRDLPERLGADIQKETNGFTYSQSVKGRTVFTIHAAKATQHKDGRTGLEDVGIVLYGEKDGRADRIYGKQFEYDQKNGIVRAMGEVQLDLQAPAPTSASAKAAYARGAATELIPAKSADAQPIHVVTSGLVYLQSLGVASTDQPIHFAYRGMTGQARGAAYNSDTGVTTLESEVRISAIRDGRPTVLTAAHAELDRVSHRVVLRTARYVALEAAESEGGGGESMTAGMMVVHLGADGGGIERAEGSGGVEVVSGESRMQAPNGVLRLRGEGRPEEAQMTGGVRFVSEQETKKEQMEGSAATGLAHFDERGAMKAVHLSGGVQARSTGTAVGSARTMQSGEMDLLLSGEASGNKRWVQQATMSGDARFESGLPEVAGHTAGSEGMRGDVLVSQFRLEQGGAVLRAIRGDGHTEIRRRRDGVEEVSHGDHLEAELGTQEGTKTETGPKLEITTALQRGKVVMDRTVQTAIGGATRTETSHARAEQVRYDAAAGHVSLTGEPEIADGGSVMRADRITLTQKTGDTEAVGAVQVTYRQRTASKTDGGEGGPGVIEPGEPMHAVADRAMLRKESGVATFFGTPKLRARLWQGGSQVEAPVLAFHRDDATLDAYGGNASELMPVRTVLASKPEAGDGTAGSKAKKGGAQVLRVQSGRLHYADGLHRAEFSKGVVLDDADGTMTSRDAVALLASSAKKEAVPAPGADVRAGLGGLSSGGVERVTASGDVVIRQPGRVATGQQAVYTAADGLFVLTGGGGVAPKVTDEVNGSVTGAALRFRAGDNSVTVEGRAKDGTPVTGDGRVHTHTRVKQ